MSRYVFVYSDTTSGSCVSNRGTVNWKIDKLKSKDLSEATQEAQELLVKLRETGWGTIDTPYIVPIGVFEEQNVSFVGEENNRNFVLKVEEADDV